MSVVLMAGSGALAYVLDHDAVGETAVLDRARPGDDVTVKGTLQPFVPVAASAHEAAAWRHVASHLDNFTYSLDTGADQGSGADVVLVTTPAPAALGSAIVTSGPVVLRILHPDGSDRMVVVVHATDLESPILFR